MIDLSTTNWIIYQILIHVGWWIWAEYKIWKEFDGFRNLFNELVPQIVPKETQMDVIAQVESRIEKLEAEMKKEIEENPSYSRCFPFSNKSTMKKHLYKPCCFF